MRPEPLWEPGDRNTVARNFRAGLEYIKENLTEVDIITIMEDDDWYSPLYLKTARLALVSNPDAYLFGEVNTVYYNVASRLWRQNWHPGHASLCSVSFRIEILDDILEAISGYSGSAVDHRIFNAIPAEKQLLLDSNHVVGIKGIPAEREAASLTVHTKLPQGMPDPNLSVLRSWIGEDADVYREFYELPTLDKEERTTRSKKAQEEVIEANMTPSQKRYLAMRKSLKG